MTASRGAVGVVGEVDVVDGRGVVRMESSYDTDIADLWQAITAPERIARWIAKVEIEDPGVGGMFQARFTSGWAGAGRIETCAAPHHLRLTLSPDTEDETEIEAWLTADGPRTRLVIAERGLSASAVHLHGAGWQAHVEDLGRYLAGQPARDWSQRWTELTPHYLATRES